MRKISMREAINEALHIAFNSDPNIFSAGEDIAVYELLLLELATGLRRGEILALQWGYLNFRTGALRVERQVHRVKGELVVSPP